MWDTSQVTEPTVLVTTMSILEMADKPHNPIPLYTAEFVPPSHTNIDIAIDKNNNIWIAFVTLPNLQEHESDNEEEVSKTLNILSLIQTEEYWVKCLFLPV